MHFISLILLFWSFSHFFLKQYEATDIRRTWLEIQIQKQVFTKYCSCINWKWRKIESISPKESCHTVYIEMTFPGRHRAVDMTIIHFRPTYTCWPKIYPFPMYIHRIRKSSVDYLHSLNFDCDRSLFVLKIPRICQN